MDTLEILRNYLPKSKVKLFLFASFVVLLLTQLIMGFRYLDDYLVPFVFVLFLNDQFFKFKHPEKIYLLKNEKKIRLLMTIFFIVLFSLPALLDYYHVSERIQFFLYKMGFILWAQVFLLDAFNHYKETNSKKWLLFANTAVAMIFIGAFVF